MDRRVVGRGERHGGWSEVRGGGQRSEKGRGGRYVRTYVVRFSL